MGEMLWDRFAEALKDGPRRLKDLADVVYGPCDDVAEKRLRRHAAASVLIRMMEGGVVERPSYGLYALPGTGEPARGPQRLYEILRENREDGMTYSDMMEATGAGHAAIRKWVARLYKLDLIRSVVEKDRLSSAYHRRYFAKRGLKGNRDLLFGETPPKAGYATIGSLPEGSALAFNAALRRLETSTLRKYGLDGWVPTLVLRDPSNNLVAVTKDNPSWVKEVIRP